jgi:protocatechuate 3,4-dioxygenase beta subunit
MVRGSRRLFLRTAALLAAAWAGVRLSAQGLGQFGSEGPAPCNVDEKPTPATPQGPEYKPDAPQRTSLIEPGVTGVKVVITGTLSGLTCGPIKRARIEFWQPDAKGVYDAAGFRLRGQQFTDSNGRYRLETIVPGAPSKHAPVVHVKAQPPGKAAFATQMFFPNQPANKNDPQFRPELVAAVAETNGVKTATFNIVLNI